MSAQRTTPRWLAAFSGLLLPAGLALAVGGCRGSTTAVATATGPSAASASPVSGAQVPSPRIAGRPRLLLLVIIDQLPSWALSRYLPHLSERGLLRRAAADGVYFERVQYQYANTLTATGHAAIASGASPTMTGVVGNAWYDRKDDVMRAMVADERYPTFGHETVGVSPRVLRVDTVGDRLVAASGGKSQVVALSLKDRAAVLSGGKRAQWALWYDQRAGGFTTSSYYAAALPVWLKAFRAAHPPNALLRSWRPLNATMLEKMGLRDDGPGEGDWLGFGTTFPHHLQHSHAPQRLIKLAPPVSAQLVDLALHSARSLSLGVDEHPDLLVVSMSGTDYAGHTFGAESWEYVDQLMRADVALGKLFDTLAETVSVDVLITADHGVARLPEASQQGGRIERSELLALAKGDAEETGLALAHFAFPHVYLTDNARQDALMLAAISKRLSSHPGVFRVFDTRRAQALRDSDDELERAVGHSLVAGRSGDLYCVLKPGWLLDENRPAGAGTTHGSPWPYDRQVPLLMLGDGVPRLHKTDVVAQSRVAATVAAYLGQPGPPWSGRPLMVPIPTEAGRPPDGPHRQETSE